MLNLLTLEEASLIILNWYKKIPDPLDPDTKLLVLNDPELKQQQLLQIAFLKNAIDAEELPCFKKAKGKAEDDKVAKNAGVPEEYRSFLPKGYDIWITWDDLIAFFQRSPLVSTKAYSHAREALARLAWVLLRHEGYLDTPNGLNESLQDILIDLQTKNMDAKLGEVTLKGCIREILAAGDSILSKN